RSAHPVPFQTSKAHLASTFGAGVHFAATEISKATGLEGRAGLEDKVLTLDLLSFTCTEHRLVQRPQCPACGQPRQIAAPGALTFTSHPKRPGLFADARTATPEETFERYKHHISPITGIVTSFLSRDVYAHEKIHNYTAGHYFPTRMADTATLRVNQI